MHRITFSSPSRIREDPPNRTEQNQLSNNRLSLSHLSSAMDELTKIIAILLTLAALLPHVSSEIPRQEIESATAALRSRGYNLFGNSLTVSDLLFEVLSGKEFTFLSPPDTSLFSLGMSTDSFRYVHSLRLHVIPRRLSVTDLRNLSVSRTPSVDSLIPTNSIFLSNHRREFTAGDRDGPGSGAATAFDYVVVNGVRISSPDIYLGQHIAVHGLDGTLAADMLPPESFQGDLGLGFVSPPAWSPSERLAPLPSTRPIQDSVPPPASPLIEAFSPDFKGSPIFPLPEPPVPIPRVSSPFSERFANSPKSAQPAPGSFTPVSPPPSISTSPKIPKSSSPWNDQSNSRGTGQVGSSFRPINPSPKSSPSVKTFPPRQAPFSPRRIRGTPRTHPKGWKNDPSHPWEKPKKSHESTEHRRSKKKHKCGKHHHHRKHKGL